MPARRQPRRRHACLGLTIERARAVRAVVLETKWKVAQDLPERSEELLRCSFREQRPLAEHWKLSRRPPSADAVLGPGHVGSRFHSDRRVVIDAATVDPD